MKPDDLPFALAERTEGVALAELVALDGAGGAWIALEGESGPRAALSIVALGAAQRGGRVVVAFERGESARPIVVGLVQGADQGNGEGVLRQRAPGHVEVSADGQALSVVATQELTLRCGRSSISLRADGRIEI